ncbi:hypothetical protein [Streptomyces sp. NPDC093109]|uniref:hypothetical protein n=1 Tax=Streptomyces sp. NPDC093109 TaxID=3154977 RepID=UPI00344C11EC
MSVDPTDPDTFETNGEDGELDDEVPEADAAEQQREVRHRGDEPLTHIDPDTASEGDAAEQARAVDGDEDDYRP